MACYAVMCSLRRSICLAASIALLASVVPAFASDAKDPLAAEIERWLAIAQSRTETDRYWVLTKQSEVPELERAREELRAGWRLVALQRFADAQTDLAAIAYMLDRPAQERKDMAGFDAAWKRMEGELRSAPSAAALAGTPAAVRALGEVAIPQVQVYHQASLDYGHNTMADAGLAYLGLAQSQRDIVDFYRKLPAPSPLRPAPPLRSLRPELEALKADMLSVYRPPVSIDRHAEFIVASSTLKEARELEAAGLQYGALLRYLQAAQQFAPLRPAPPPPLAAEALDKRLSELAARLSAGEVDHGIGQLFLETARSEAARATPGSPSVAASQLASDVLPRYFAALEPARPQAPTPEPQVTVTLVRWPYT